MADQFIEVPSIELDDLLGRPADRVAEAIPAGLGAWGGVMEKAIASRAPDKTGALLAELATSVEVDSDRHGGTAEIGFGGDQAAVARFLEMGHREVGHRPLKKLEGAVAPRPFIRPAATAAEQAANDAFDEAVAGKLIG